MTKVFQLIDDDIQTFVRQREDIIKARVRRELIEAMLEEGIELLKIKKITGLSMKSIEILQQLASE